MALHCITIAITTIIVTTVTSLPTVPKTDTLRRAPLRAYALR